MNKASHRLLLLIVIGVMGTIQVAIASPKPIQLEITTPVGSISLK